MNASHLRIDAERLNFRLHQLAQIGAVDGGGVHRLTLTDENKQARDLVVNWMRELKLKVTVDRIGNIVGIRAGKETGPPVMTGSHIDTVINGGRFDGSLGVLAGLEVIATLNDAGIATVRPLAVGVFTNEEGVRFQPDMMGSAVHQGSQDLESMLASVDADGLKLGDELKRIGYAGETPVGSMTPHCFVELHIEQGPILEESGIAIASVEGVQGISWTEIAIIGVANHAGTTPMRLRRDAGLVAAEIAVEVRKLAREMGENQVATVGCLELSPNAINVIPQSARITVDLRNKVTEQLQTAETKLESIVEAAATREGVKVKTTRLVHFDPVVFDAPLVDCIENAASNLGHSVKRIWSGAGHDAQMFAPNCPTAMIFVPSKNGISHNVKEFTSPEEICAGANVLLQVLLTQSQL